MRRLFSIGPWLVELINPPPRNTLTLVQKGARVLLVTITLVTLCIIAALVVSLAFFVGQRSRDVLRGVPQLMNVLMILSASIIINTACVVALFQIKRIDRKLIPKLDVEIEIPLPPRSR
jgi:hypothetical protein